jgi:hypothetical protein
MGSVPVGKFVVLSVATPLFSQRLPSVVEPDLNVTSPVGEVVRHFTVAVNVTFCPLVEGLGLEVSVVMLAARFTVWFIDGEVLARKFESPRYFAVTLHVPTGTVDVLIVATPALSVPVPK